MNFYGTTPPLEVGKHVCSLLIFQGLLGENDIFDGVALLLLDVRGKSLNIGNTKSFLQGPVSDPFI